MNLMKASALALLLSSGSSLAALNYEAGSEMHDLVLACRTFEEAYILRVALDSKDDTVIESNLGDCIQITPGLRYQILKDDPMFMELPIRVIEVWNKQGMPNYVFGMVKAPKLMKNL